MSGISLYKLVVAIPWFLSAFLFWAEYKKIRIVHNVLYRTSLSVLSIRDRISTLGLFHATERLSYRYVRYIFLPRRKLITAYARNCSITIAIIFIITIILSAISYISTFYLVSNPVNIERVIFTDQEKHDILKRVRHCFSDTKDITPACKRITDLNSIKISLQKRDPSGKLFELVKANPVAYYSFCMDFINNLMKYFLKQEGLKNLLRFYYIDTMSKLISSAIFYTIFGSILLLASSFITMSLITLADKSLSRSIFAHVFAPPVIVVIDVTAAIMCFILFFSVVFILFPYVYYVSRIIEHGIATIGAILFYKPLDLASLLRDSLVDAARSNPGIPSELVPALKIKNMDKAIIDPAQLFLSQSLFPNLSVVAHSSHLQKLFYFSHGLRDALGRLFDDLNIDLRLLVTLHWDRISAQDTLRNYFLAIPMLPMLIHAIIYFSLVLFLLFYYIIFIPVTEICSAAIDRGPACVYASVLAALFGLIAFLFPGG